MDPAIIEVNYTEKQLSSEIIFNLAHLSLFDDIFEWLSIAQFWFWSVNIDNKKPKSNAVPFGYISIICFLEL